MKQPKNQPVDPAIVTTSGITDVLRSYQRRDYRDVLAACERYRRVLYVAFMGSGKTVLAASLIRTWVARGERVLIVAHTREILRQTDAKLRAAAGGGLSKASVGWIWRDGIDDDGDSRARPDAHVQLASLDTLRRRELPTGIRRLVIDEAHHAPAKKWRAVIDAYPEARVLGLTGTPARLDGQPLGDIFEEMVQSEPTETLIEQGWISRPEYWTPEWNAKLPRNSGGELSSGEADRAMTGTPILASMVSEWRQHAEHLPTVGFAATKEKATLYAEQFAKAGIASGTLFGTDTDLVRMGTLARLRSGKIRVVWTCDVLSEGWDYAGLRCVMLARPTLSIARYLQQVARCMRQGHAPPVILDLWGAWRIFDPPWSDHGWSLNKAVRKGICVGIRAANGSVTWSPPIEIDGRLVRAGAIQRILCAMCGEPASMWSARNVHLGGRQVAYCAAHKGGPSKHSPIPRCDVPGCLSSARRRNARFCRNHKNGGKAERTPTPCAMPGCESNATRQSAAGARHFGTRAYCHTHKRGRAEPMRCSARGCAALATYGSARSARAGLCRPYCKEHKGGPSAPKEPGPCAATGCTNLATKNSYYVARARGGQAYCMEHRGGRGFRRPRQRMLADREP